MVRKWWGEFAAENGATLFWRIGPLQLWATRLAEEWRVATESTGDPLADEVIVASDPPGDPGPDAVITRFGFRASPKSLHVLPASADRPVVVKAVSPFFVPPGEEITLFVSTTLWLQLRSGAKAEPLHDTPLNRPSDSWFGPSTIEGQLCYAARISIRYELDEVPRRPHRAVSVVRIRNRAATQLAVEKLKLPLPFLSIYGSESGQLWTEPITLERVSEDENATVQLGQGAPRIAGEARRIARPREKAEAGLLTRTFGSLFRRTGMESRG